MPVERINSFTQNQASTAHKQIRVYSPFNEAGVKAIQGIQEDKRYPGGIKDARLALFQRDFSKEYKVTRSWENRANISGEAE